MNTNALKKRRMALLKKLATKANGRHDVDLALSEIAPTLDIKKFAEGLKFVDKANPLSVGSSDLAYDFNTLFDEGLIQKIGLDREQDSDDGVVPMSSWVKLTLKGVDAVSAMDESNRDVLPAHVKKDSPPPNAPQQLRSWIAIIPLAAGAAAIAVAKLGSPVLAIFGVAGVGFGIILFALIWRAAQETQSGKGKFWDWVTKLTVLFVILYCVVLAVAAVPTIYDVLGKELKKDPKEEDKKVISDKEKPEIQVTPTSIAVIDAGGTITQEEAQVTLEKIYRQKVSVVIFDAETDVPKNKFDQIAFRDQDNEGHLLFKFIVGTKKHIPVNIEIEVALVSETSKLTFSEVKKVASVLQKQIDRDLGPIWSVKAHLKAFEKLGDVPKNDWPIIVKEDVSVPGALGIHLDKDGIPFSLVTYGGEISWSLIASRECLQMLVDPFGNRLVKVPSPDPKDNRKVVEMLVEVAGPVGSESYQLEGIQVSDFVTPSYYNVPIDGDGGRYSFTGAVKRPMEVLKGGYGSWHDPQTDEWKQKSYFWGEKAVIRSLGIIKDTKE
jgi:hypothetical protein